METMVKCPKCGADAPIAEEQLAPKKPIMVWLGYLLVMGVITYMVYHYGTMPVYSGGDFQFYAFMVLWVVCLIAYPLVMSRVYKKRLVKVIRCSTCGHIEVTTPLPSGAKEWNLVK